MGSMDLWSNWRSSKKTFLSCISKWRVYNRWRLARPHVYVSHFLRTTEREWCFNRKELCTSFYVCFGLASAAYVFAKLLKISMALLRRTGIHIVIYLDEMLIIGRTREETTALRETVTHLLQCLRFVINQKNSVMSPVQEKEFLEKIVISKEITIFLPKKKLQLIRVSGSTSESTDKFWSWQRC